MNKILIIIVSLLILAFLGYKVLYPSPTPVVVDLKQELMQTEDDGGKADFDALSQDAVGL
ncbi:MAG: hypothetical protein Q8L51_00340 [Candidatus Amesbacteria bacterium]|nr:hypothetical protein [Candidatus Amesbacteria bacterium]